MRRTFPNLVRLLGVVAIVCGLVAVASAPMAAAGPTLSLTPSQGDVDTSVTINGSGFTANGYLPVGNIKFAGVPWNNAVVPIDPNGQFHVVLAVASNAEGGFNTVVATDNASIQASATFNVKITLASIAIAPPAINLPAQRYSMLAVFATGTYSNGSTQDITTHVDWSSSNTQVAEVLAETVHRWCVAYEVGATTIRASVSGVTSNAVIVTVGAPSSIEVTPRTVSELTKDDTQQFTATGYYHTCTGGDCDWQVDVTGQATWRSSNTGVATMSSSQPGLATCVGDGSADITASLPDWSISNAVTLTGSVSYNTHVGSLIQVHVPNSIITFPTVSQEGQTIWTTSAIRPPGPPPPPSYRVISDFIDIRTTATYSSSPSNPVTVGISYNPASTSHPQNLRLFHWNGTSWDQLTTSVDQTNHMVCGQVSSLSPFFVGEEVAQTGEGCFIATAAYGSYLDSHVETLRDFRDSYMVTNPVGRNLVSAYYKLSPPLAEFIDEHPALKPIVRVGLVPAVVMSTVAVNTTMAEKLAILASLALVCIALAIWVRERARRLGRGR